MEINQVSIGCFHLSDPETSFRSHVYKRREMESNAQSTLKRVAVHSLMIFLNENFTFSFTMIVNGILFLFSLCLMERSSSSPGPALS